MPSAYVLFLNDHVAAPALELIRRIADPASSSRPHVTVRYPVRKIDPKLLSMYNRERVDRIELHAPGSFERNGDVRPKTVFIECFSDQLDRLEYKPDYPDSVFHITLYDSVPSAFSANLLSLVREFSWGLDVRLDHGTQLSEIPIGKSKGRSVSPAELSEDAASLYEQVARKPGQRHEFANLDDDSRLKLIRSLCLYLHQHLLSVSRPSPRTVEPSAWDNEADNQGAGQMLLWSDNQVGDLGLRPTSQSQRALTRRLSLYLTPPEVAHDMTRAALEHHGTQRPVDFGDPAVGNGIFLASLLGQGGGWPRSAVGVDVSVDRVRVLNRRWGTTGFRAIAADFLEEHPTEPRSLILANPPYLRSQGLPRVAAERWCSRIEAETDISISGRADLYTYFLLGAHRWMQPDATACWLLPLEFAKTAYGRAVRKYLTTLVTLDRVHLYDSANSRFENARVSSAVILFRNARPSAEHVVNVSVGDSMEFPADRASMKLAELRREAVWNLSSARWLKLRSPEAPKPLPSGKHVPVIGDLFRVRRGIATGANAYFVVDDAKREFLGGEDEWFKPVIPKSRYLNSNEVLADDFGYPLTVPRQWLIDLDVDLKTIKRVAPNLAAYLTHVQATVGDRRLLQNRKCFYSQDRIPSPPVFFGYMARLSSVRFASRFFINHSKAVILNNYLGLYPVGEIAHLYSSGSVTRGDLYAALRQVEASRIDDESRHYAAGLAKIEPSELMRVPLGPLGRRLYDR